MNESLLVLGLVIIIGLIITVIFMVVKLNATSNSVGVDMLKSDVTELSRTITDLRSSMGETLERNAQSMQTSVQRQLSESVKLVNDVSQRLTKLDETNRRVVDVADEL
ncbi:hypothetical protein B7Z17_00755, partial [Candidatus Saccharibacteria bacterium 32-49-10]